MATTTAAMAALSAIGLAKERLGLEDDLDMEGKTESGQYQDADAAAAADPVQKRGAAMAQTDASVGVDNPTQGSPMAASGMPGQQGGADALAASKKATAQGAAAVAQMEAMSQRGPGGPATPAPKQPEQISNLFNRRRYRRF